MSGRAIVLLALIIGFVVIFTVSAICDCIKEIIKNKRQKGN